MGGYAAFVWPAYAVSALGLGGLVVSVWRRRLALRRRLDHLTAPGGDEAAGGAAP